MNPEYPSAMDREKVLVTQLAFLRERRAGCLFAAVAAQDPRKYGWVHRFPGEEENAIDTCIAAAVDAPEVTMVSLLFPEVIVTEDLLQLIRVLRRCEMLSLEQVEPAFGSICLGFRAKVGELRSYVTGFGNFPFLPKTRRAPFVELVMRVKPRPHYEFVFKEAPPNVIHLADLDMLGMERERLWGLWEGSFVETEKRLEEKPDLRSAARTTFSIPSPLLTGVL
jgi:hypothetical protein